MFNDAYLMHRTKWLLGEKL